MFRQTIFFIILKVPHPCPVSTPIIDTFTGSVAATNVYVAFIVYNLIITITHHSLLSVE